MNNYGSNGNRDEEDGWMEKVREHGGEHDTGEVITETSQQNAVFHCLM